jgi:hypothetical protein
MSGPPARKPSAPWRRSRPAPDEGATVELRGQATAVGTSGVSPHFFLSADDPRKGERLKVSASTRDFSE